MRNIKNMTVPSTSHGMDVTKHQKHGAHHTHIAVEIILGSSFS